MKLYIGEQLKALRKEKQITQEVLADVLGVSYQSVSRWELGVCYPDMELLPIIANYFGITIDRLLSNDAESKEIEIQRFYEKVDSMDFGSLEQMQFVEEFYHKHPENDWVAFILQDIMKNYLSVNKDKVSDYLPDMIKLYHRLKGTYYHEGAVGNIICVCPEEELDEWLNLCSWNSSYTRRGCLVSRYDVQVDFKNSHLHQSIEAFENFALQLDRRFPDAFGPTRKAAYHRDILKIIASFGDGTTPPDGWALFYAYKQFVLAACLFGDNKPEEGWKEFDEAIATYRRIFALEDKWLPLGNAIFSDLKVRRDYHYMLDSEGKEHEIYGAFYTNFGRAGFLHAFLTEPRWAWFDSIRNTPKYQEAVEWAKAEADKEEAEETERTKN
ncbi:MAG: helix-turn-helix transcriptional regulator [Lachnospiraceae bacterium]|nr:helix-turn-helix transcriptional regulator [Lachnospiraceae bacterium]